MSCVKTYCFIYVKTYCTLYTKVKKGSIKDCQRQTK